MLRILSTKLLPTSLIDSAHLTGIDLICIDLISMDYIDFDMARDQFLTFDALVFTSSNAVKSFFKNEKAINTLLSIKSIGTEAISPSSLHLSLANLNIYTTSGKTKDELLKLGLSPRSVADNALMLAEQILIDSHVRSVLHICGTLTLDTLWERLTQRGLYYRRLPVYETILNTLSINELYDAIMFYSPSGVEAFAAKNNFNTDTIYCCIGSTTAESLRAIAGYADIILPEHPTPESMLDAIINCKQIRHTHE